MLCLKCEKCEGRWVALPLGSTVHAGRCSYHFSSDSLRCPRCDAEGIVDDEVIFQHQRHPQVVATTLSRDSRG